LRKTCIGFSNNTSQTGEKQLDLNQISNSNIPLSDTNNLSLDTDSNSAIGSIQSDVTKEKSVKRKKVDKVVNSIKSVNTNIFSTTKKLGKLFPVRANKQEGITSKTTFNSDLLTVGVILLLLLGAIAAFQFIEGSTGLIIGAILLAGIIAIAVT